MLKTGIQRWTLTIWGLETQLYFLGLTAPVCTEYQAAYMIRQTETLLICESCSLWKNFYIKQSVLSFLIRENTWVFLCIECLEACYLYGMRTEKLLIRSQGILVLLCSWEPIKGKLLSPNRKVESFSGNLPLSPGLSVDPVGPTNHLANHHPSGRQANLKSSWENRNNLPLMRRSFPARLLM